MAASFLIALGLGPLLRGLPWRVSRPGPSIADITTGGPELRETRERISSSESLASTETATSGDSAAAPSILGPSPWQTVTVAVPDGSGQGRQSIQVPVMQENRLDSSWLKPSPETLPAEVRDVLQRAGCQVRHSRQLLPGSMEDGRRVVVPVDQVEVRYVGNHGYQ